MHLNKISLSVPRNIVVGLVAALLLAMPNRAGDAADASNWDSDLNSAMRLLAGGASEDGGVTVLRAGIELQLKPGWKTYWRYPGDSGIPPRFDFSGSSNVVSTLVAWPAPKRFADGSGMSIGYERGVIFPVRVVPQDPAKPVLLRLKIDYAVCRDLCVPAAGQGELTLERGKGSFGGMVAAAEARVPKSVALDDRGSLAIRSVRREDGPGSSRITVDVAAPASQSVDLFAEGPSSDWALPLPERVAGAPPGLQRFAFALDGVPPGGNADKAMLTLTAVTDQQAIEVRTRLD